MKERYEELIRLLKYHADLYYNKNVSEITDAEYDKLMQELREIEKAHPELVKEDSISQVIGGKAELGTDIQHNVPMLSIEDVFSKDDVLKWVNKVHSLHPDATFSVEGKIDGLSMTLRYKCGKLYMAETRGDGFMGEVVTENALNITDIPHVIDVLAEYLEVRGEVYMTYRQLEKINEKLDEKSRFTNPRNCASGSLRNLNPDVTKSRGLKFMAFNIQDGPASYMEQQEYGLRQLEGLGFSVAPHYICRSADEILDAIDKIGEQRKHSEYPIDGAVIKINEIDLRKEFPCGKKYSAGHIAYKYPAEEKVTTVTDILIQVSPKGRLTPVAVFDPINLGGTTISKATLNNQDFITNFGIDVGAEIAVCKSGDIIPKITRCIKRKAPFRIPQKCPCCHKPTARIGAYIMCENPECESKTTGKTSIFSKEVLK